MSETRVAGQAKRQSVDSAGSRVVKNRKLVEGHKRQTAGRRAASAETGDADERFRVGGSGLAGGRRARSD